MRQTQSMKILFISWDFIGEQIIKKHTASNELPCYISGDHRLPVASLIPAKMHVL